MSNRLPSNLPGGWEFTQPFAPVPLARGQIWRKRGPVDAIEIVRVMMPGHPEHDGGLCGVSVRPTVIGRRGVNWGRRTWFKAGTEAQILDWLREHGYALCQDSPESPIQQEV